MAGLLFILVFILAVAGIIVLWAVKSINKVIRIAGTVLLSFVVLVCVCWFVLVVVLLGGID